MISSLLFLLYPGSHSLYFTSSFRSYFISRKYSFNGPRIQDPKMKLIHVATNWWLTELVNKFVIIIIFELHESLLTSVSWRTRNIHPVKCYTVHTTRNFGTLLTLLSDFFDILFLYSFPWSCEYLIFKRVSCITRRLFILGEQKNGYYAHLIW